MAMVRFPTLPPLMLPSVTTKVPAALFTWVTMPMWSPAPVQSPFPVSSQSYTQAPPTWQKWASFSTQMPLPFAICTNFSTPHSVPVYSAIPAFMYAALTVAAQ